MGTEDLPLVNACLNATAAMLLSIGWLAIKRRNVGLHKACMGSAFATSILFLASYLVYHYVHGSTPFPGQGWIRPVYYAILITHVVLAAAVPPLAVAVLWRALKGRFADHARLARVALPIWLYVSVTGVAIYVLLYRLYPAPGA